MYIKGIIFPNSDQNLIRKDPSRQSQLTVCTLSPTDNIFRHFSLAREAWFLGVKKIKTRCLWGKKKVIIYKSCDELQNVQKFYQYTRTSNNAIFSSGIQSYYPNFSLFTWKFALNEFALVKFFALFESFWGVFQPRIKDQLILKCLFGVFNSPQKERK